MTNSYQTRASARKHLAFPTQLTVAVGPSGLVLEVTGRQAWALAKLIHAGARGVVFADAPAPRWSSYVAHLREKGIAVTTEIESNDPPFPGRHGRYRLACVVRPLASIQANSSSSAR